jgi:hypothetical protein
MLTTQRSLYHHRGHGYHFETIFVLALLHNRDHVCKHNLCLSTFLQHNFEPQWLSLTFSKAIFLGNGLVAILAGLIANFLVVDLDFGPVAPFDTAAVFLAIGCGVIVKTWSENYGDTNEEKTLQQQFQQAWNSILAGKVLY